MNLLKTIILMSITDLFHHVWAVTDVLKDSSCLKMIRKISWLSDFCRVIAKPLKSSIGIFLEEEELFVINL